MKNEGWNKKNIGEYEKRKIQQKECDRPIVEKKEGLFSHLLWHKNEMMSKFCLFNSMNEPSLDSSWKIWKCRSETDSGFSKCQVLLLHSQPIDIDSTLTSLIIAI